MTRTARPVWRAVGAAVVAATALAACSAGDQAGSSGTAGPSVAGSSGGSSGGGAGASIEGLTGVPADLAVVVRALYAGGSVPADPAVAAALVGRTAGPTVTVRVTTGSWHGSRVAVVTSPAPSGAGDAVSWRAGDVSLLVAASGGTSWRVVGGWWPNLGKPAVVLPAGPRFVLVAGSDARPGEPVEKSRADALHVVGIDGRSAPAAPNRAGTAYGGGTLGIPRDSWVPLASGGTGKINAALTFGGPFGLLRTVRTTTGLPIEGYVVAGFDGFVRAVDGLGGLPITLAKAIKGAASGVDLPAGAQRLDGGMALAFSRERKTLPTGDFGRSAHQNDVLLAALARARTLGPGAVPAAMTLLDRTTISDLTAAHLLTFAVALQLSDPGRFGSAVATGGFGTRAGQSVVLLGDAARRVFAGFADGNLP